MEIDPVRQEILDASGHLLIVGGPGCGKTTIALLKAQARLAALEPEQRVLFLSFSRAAVRQITDRMSGVLDRASRQRLEVRTFHAFFLDVVRSHGRLLTGRPSSFITPDRERQIQADFDGDWKSERRRLATEEGRYVFDLLADTTATLLERSAALRALYSSIYPLVIVDEFQDTNTDQWRVIKAVSGASTVICLADPDQRIFDHLDGVEEQRLDDAVAHLAPTPFDLSKDNHRSPGGGLLDYANAVLNNTLHAEPANVHTWTYTPVYGVPWQTRVHHGVIAMRDYLTTQLGHTPTIAVLASVNSLLGQVSEALATDTITGNTTLPAVDHALQWDPELTAAAGYVVASIMEWPGLPRVEAVTRTVQALADFYRVKLTSGTAGARDKIKTLENGLSAFMSGKTIRSKTVKAVTAAYDAGISYLGQPVADWPTARDRLHGSNELEEVLKHARLLRLLNATDALAWGLSDSWDGDSAYKDAAATVRAVLAAETLTAAQQPPETVSLMSMHRSKGKEFDGVIIVEGPYTGTLLDPSWPPERLRAQRRLLRVAITRARTMVLFIRPQGSQQLTRTR
ncbi:UvrD-helicase domain-containing protein [Streptomyces flavotricini]|uniref:DNA 3'-5' helicase n=1 Tax=Streptomyces flavotricini TaxID=66888 RepID=A0ABS8E0J2_9ACTN|nr:UvrD-helicase domain-containing protein [Streptomyces flavotricini]MCC0094661.1 UvrD-helicase domain-containing protein [Streptomyces flavotricini]